MRRHKVTRTSGTPVCLRPHPRKDNGAVTTVSLDGDRGHGNVKARLADDPRPQPQPEPTETPEPEPVDGVWTIPTEDGVTMVPEKLAAWAAGRRAAQARKGST
jgi:hypothetical protein